MLRFILPPPTLLLLYYSLIHSHFLFGLPIWRNTYPTYLTKLQQLQNKAIPIISNSSIKTAITPQFYKLSVLKVHLLHEFEIAKLMHQHSRLGVCYHLYSILFFKNFPINTPGKLEPRPIIISIFPDIQPTDPKNQQKYQGAKLLNSLFIELRNESISKFKRIYEQIFLNKYR